MFCKNWQPKVWLAGVRLALSLTVIIMLILVFTRYKTASIENSKICSSTFVNSIAAMKTTLEKCTVIEGSLVVVLIEKGSENEFENVSFPLLREVTGFVFFYRVKYLRSLGQIFPNLSIIRGSNLFMNFALVIYEMHDLQEVGLYNLRTIERGSVGVFNNTNLCFVDTVDWRSITRDMGWSWIKSNKSPELCGKCHSNCNHCWSAKRCQQKQEAPNFCRPLCLGGCSGPSAHQCFVCKGVLTPDNNCVESCPPGTVKWMERRCINLKTCLNNSFADPHHMFKNKINFFVFNGSCVRECPEGFEKEPSGCRQCTFAHCIKPCQGQVVDSLSAAQNLTGCTHIIGSLTINIKTGSDKFLQQELYKSLGSIQEIEGSLKIVGTLTLVSLNFLRNLRIIHGNSSFSDNKSFVLTENHILQKVWDWNIRPRSRLQILNGSVSVHNNPKLCLSLIKRFIENINFTNTMGLLDISEESNGNKFPCKTIDLNVRVLSRCNESIVLYMENPKDKGLFSRYILYYVKSPFQNISYEEQNVCVDCGWKTKDISSDWKFEGTYNITHRITHLEPNSQYAFYIETYFNDSSALRSGVQYFQTLPSKPIFRTKLEGLSETSSSITLKWNPPNGKIEKYILHGYKQTLDEEVLLNRDYCTDPLQYNEANMITLPKVVESNQRDRSDSNENGKSICEKIVKMGPAKLKHTQLIDAIQMICENFRNYKYFSKRNTDFHDGLDCEKSLLSALNNGPVSDEGSGYVGLDSLDEIDVLRVFQSQVSSATQKISKGSIDDNFDNSLSPENELLVDWNDQVERFSFHVPGNITKTQVDNLSQFSDYTIEISACREVDLAESTDLSLGCSFASKITLRTKQNKTADGIPSVSHIFNKTTVMFKWSKPTNPNGLIVSYSFEYRLIDGSSSKQESVCISVTDYYSNQKKGYNYILENLPAGTYSYRLKALSMAGEGEYTESVYFEIEEEEFSFSFKLILVSCFKLLVVIFMIFCTLFVSFVFVCRLSLSYLEPAEYPSMIFPDIIPEFQYSRFRYVADEWKLSRNNIKIVKEIGEGRFGRVYEGLLKPDNVPCAVKTARNNRYLHRDLLREASTMKVFKDAHHIVKLLGVVNRGLPVLVVMELMTLGDLKKFLISVRDNKMQPRLSTKTMLQMAAQIADGMTYLQSMDLMHGDLAARNCMVAEDLTVKVGDLGMSRQIYETDYYRSTKYWRSQFKSYPIRWMAPEKFRSRIYTSQSDVWSYGVVLWEISTLAELPYQDKADDDIIEYVAKHKKTLCIPPFCPDVIKPIMLSCWKWEPSHRPTFLQIVNQLEIHTNGDFKTVSFFHSAKAADLRENLKKPPCDLDLTELVFPGKLTELQKHMLQSYYRKSMKDDTNEGVVLLSYHQYEDV